MRNTDCVGTQYASVKGSRTDPDGMSWEMTKLDAGLSWAGSVVRLGCVRLWSLSGSGFSMENTSTFRLHFKHCTFQNVIEHNLMTESESVNKLQMNLTIQQTAEERLSALHEAFL